MRRRSRFSPRPTRSRSERSNCSGRSGCRQKPEPRSHVKCLSRKAKLARRLVELRAKWSGLKPTLQKSARRGGVAEEANALGIGRMRGDREAEPAALAV